MELPSQPDLRQLGDGYNTFNQWGADKRGDRRPRDYGDDGSLSGINTGNNIPCPSRSPPEPDPQGEELFPRNSFVNRRTPQAVMGLPETHSEVSSRKERIQLLASSEEDCKVEVITRTPPVKRQRFGNRQIPMITCSKQFEEDDSRQKSEVGKTNENPDQMPFWSFEEKEAEEYSRSLECQSYLKDNPTSRRECQTIGLALADSCHDSATNKILTNASHLPVHHNLVSLRTSDFDQYTVDKEEASVTEIEPAKVEHNAGKWNNTYSVQ